MQIKYCILSAEKITNAQPSDEKVEIRLTTCSCTQWRNDEEVMNQAFYANKFSIFVRKKVEGVGNRQEDGSSIPTGTGTGSTTVSSR